jgi:hypothetical protein
MASQSFAERAFLFADDLSSKVSDEALDELTGDSSRNWGIIVIAFVLGAVIGVAVMMSSLRRAAETIQRLGTDGAAETDPATAAAAVPAEETRSWKRWAGDARSRVSQAWPFSARSSAPAPDATQP